MIVALAGIFAGYDGGFDFSSGSKYPEDVNYTIMRMFLASFGAWLVPLAYFTAIELDFSQHAVILATLMVLLGSFEILLKFYFYIHLHIHLHIFIFYSRYRISLYKSFHPFRFNVIIFYFYNCIFYG
jgi:dolichyl-phosphate-mannose--protein O-mannosyl transferase